MNVFRTVVSRLSPSGTAAINHASDVVLGHQIKHFVQAREYVPVAHVWSAYAAETFAWLASTRASTLRVLESGSFHVLSDLAVLGLEAPTTLQRPQWRDRLLAEYDMADVILVPSEAAAESFRVHGLGSKVRVIRYGVDPFFAAAPSQGPRMRDALFVGNLTSQKGADILHDLAIGLNSMGKSLTVIGRDASQTASTAFRDCPNVQLLSPVKPARLRSYFAESRSLLLPSRQEGFGMVALEAMAAGCVPVVSSAAGVSEVVSELDASLVLPPPGPVGSLAPGGRYLTRLLQLLDGDSDLGRLHAAARVFAADRSWSSYASACRQAYVVTR